MQVIKYKTEFDTSDGCDAEGACTDFSLYYYSWIE